MSAIKTPSKAVELYVKERRPEVAKSTFQNHTYHLRRFIEWCEINEVQKISEIDGMAVHEYKIWRREVGDVNEVTLKNQLCTFRVFIRWCESIELVEGNLAEKILIPDIKRGEDQRDTMINSEQAESILEYLELMEYGALRHALFFLLWHTGMRLGTVRAIDLEDYNSSEEYIQTVHRPSAGTPLKNGSAAERQINLSTSLCAVLDDYVRFNRSKVTDDNNREALLTTNTGRASKTLLRQHVNSVTRPCHYTGKCPHDRDIDDCEALQFDYAQRCPSSVSPHPIRRSAITEHLSKDVPKEIAADRMNVSVDVLEKHYDARTQSQKRKIRKKYLSNL